MPVVHLAGRFASALILALALTLVAAPAAPAQAAVLPPIGSTVCHSGPVTGWQCGTLTDVNLTVVYPGGVVYGVFRYRACSAPGDGGAPVYHGDTQIGTVLGGSGCQTFGLPTP